MGDSRAKVTIAVAFDPAFGDPEVAIFETEGSTDGDLFDLAEGLLSAADAQAERSILERGRRARGK
jgi:hypothetical protein